MCVFFRITTATSLRVFCKSTHSQILCEFFEGDGIISQME